MEDSVELTPNSSAGTDSYLDNSLLQMQVMLKLHDVSRWLQNIIMFNLIFTGSAYCFEILFFLGLLFWTGNAEGIGEMESQD